MEVIRYGKEHKEAWESFVSCSNNGTMFHTRNFLSYHPSDRFKDSSLIFTENKKTIAVLTASSIIRDGVPTLISHQGASYGGFVYNDNLSIKQAFSLTENLIDFSK